MPTHRMTEYTPGPWRVARGIHGDTRARNVFAGEMGGPDTANGPTFRRIAAVCDDPMFGVPSDPDTDEANARLIAAAPELLAVLVELDSMLASGDRYESGRWGRYMERVRAAIRKATSG